ncbi:Translin [Gautieria morchelliformis]|nr:Translin [Gautieria morchelliformis]
MSLRAGRREKIIIAFQGFRQEFDDHNDRRERLIKLSRDATNLSKKVIFLLQRVATEETDQGEAVKAAVQQSQKKFAEIIPVFDQMRTELDPDNFWRYQKTVSSAVQEYIEALSFAHYLKHNTLLTYEQVQRELVSPEGLPIFPLGLPYADYVLGVSDLTGELMRFAITSIGRQGMMSTLKANLDKATEVCNFVRACRSDWEAMTPYIRELKAKQEVTTNSLKKIEAAAYSVAIRGFERARLGDIYSPHSRPGDDMTGEREEVDPSFYTS